MYQAVPLSREFYTAGTYEVTLPPGQYRRSSVIPNYTDDTFTITITESSNEDNAANTIFAVPYYDGWKVILYWNNVVQDLDLFLKFPTGWNNVIYFDKPKNDDGTIRLDVDARLGYGPETISISNRVEGSWEFFVSNFSHDNNHTIADADAKVKVYKGGKFQAEFRVPKDNYPAFPQGAFWRVFTLNSADNSMTPINVLTTDMPNNN